MQQMAVRWQSEAVRGNVAFRNGTNIGLLSISSES